MSKFRPGDWVLFDPTTFVGQRKHYKDWFNSHPFDINTPREVDTAHEDWISEDEVSVKIEFFEGVKSSVVVNEDVLIFAPLKEFKEEDWL